MGWPLYAIYGGYLVGKYIYHRLTYEPPPPPPRPHASDIKIPRTEEGTPVPLIYGRCLVRAPVVAWYGNRELVELDDGRPLYYVDVLLNLGIGFRNGIQGVLGMFVGDARLVDDSNEFEAGTFSVPLRELQGAPGEMARGVAHAVGGRVSYVRVSDDGDPNDGPRGFVEFLNGASTQDLTSAGGPDINRSWAGWHMDGGGVDATLIPGHRGMLSVFLTDTRLFPTLRGFQIGTSPQPGSYSFDASSYLAGLGAFPTRIGDDCNPVTVIADLLTGGLGKLGLSPNIIDATTFVTAGQTLADEDHGCSLCVDERRSAHDVINEILEQIDAVLYEDPRDGLIKIKLIRPDYDLSATLLIHPGNCDAVENYAASGLSGAVNGINVQFTDRANNYATGSARAADNAAITASGETPNEANLSYPYCCTKELAETLAARELAARSQPLARCSVIVDRSFKNVMPGDVVRLSWPEYHLNEKVFRVGQVDRGTLTDGRIRLDLVQDFFFVHRRRVQPGGPVTPFPTPDLPVLA